MRASFPMRLADFPPFGLVREGEAVQVVDTESEPGVRDLARLRGYRSMLFSPLMSNGAPIGVISVTRKEAGKFAEKHVQLLQTFADQAVIATNAESTNRPTSGRRSRRCATTMMDSGMSLMGTHRVPASRSCA